MTQTAAGRSRSLKGVGSPPPHRVAVLALPGVVAFDLAVATTVFGEGAFRSVDRLDGVTPLMPSSAPRYDVRVCGPSKKHASVRTIDGFVLDAPFGLTALSWAETIVVPGTARLDDGIPTAVLNALRGAHARGARLVSICTGAFVLAATGVLDGRRATTHWAAAARLAADYPRVEVDPAVLYIDGGSVCTSAGVAAGIDLCLYLVRQDYGAETANAIARGMVVPPHRSGGQAQFVQAPVPTVDDGSLERTRRWMLAHLAEPLTIDRLARHASVSRRTFARRFVAETGTTPLQWVLAQRVLLARRLLETSDEPVARVATLAGFGDALSLRNHFGRVTGTSPLAYRRTFRGRPEAAP